jgi:hypothetical protein
MDHTQSWHNRVRRVLPEDIRILKINDFHSSMSTGQRANWTDVFHVQRVVMIQIKLTELMSSFFIERHDTNLTTLTSNISQR